MRSGGQLTTPPPPPGTHGNYSHQPPGKRAFIFNGLVAHMGETGVHVNSPYFSNNICSFFFFFFLKYRFGYYPLTNTHSLQVGLSCMVRFTSESSKHLKTNFETEDIDKM